MEIGKNGCQIENLGKAKYNNPFTLDKYTSDDEQVLMGVEKEDFDAYEKGEKTPYFMELAGPREKIFFEPQSTRAAIVTCGGLCPGLNDVIRAIVMTLYHTYGCRDILGLRYGYEGVTERFNHTPLKLTPESVDYIHERGGTILGSSRGAQDVGEMVDYMENNGIDILFAIGGDGTLRGALEIGEEILRRGIKRSVIGIPKTIDNDISLVAKSFGYETAFSSAWQAIQSAHVEAQASFNGVGIVKLMGRHSGFIAAKATLANRDVNFCLIPEVDFDMDGDQGLLNTLWKRLIKRKHAVIVVAEGAGQKYFEGMDLGKDKSGNAKNGDIGLYLKDRIRTFFKEKELDISIKYIDPSYIIRSVPANANDSVFCGFLGQMAVHAAMAGKTNVVVATWNDKFTHIPIKDAIGKRKLVSADDKLWLSVLHTTGQPSLLND